MDSKDYTKYIKFNIDLLQTILSSNDPKLKFIKNLNH